MTIVLNNWAIDNTYHERNSFENGTGANGHDTCLYGPFGEYNRFISREFTTSWSSSIPITITVRAKFWQLCQIEAFRKDF